MSRTKLGRVFLVLFSNYMCENNEIYEFYIGIFPASGICLIFCIILKCILGEPNGNRRRNENGEGQRHQVC